MVQLLTLFAATVPFRNTCCAWNCHIESSRVYMDTSDPIRFVIGIDLFLHIMQSECRPTVYMAFTKVVSVRPQSLTHNRYVDLDLYDICKG